MSSQPLRRRPIERTVPKKQSVLDRARERRDDAALAQKGLWDMTREERLKAFYAGRLTFGQCLEWSRRAQDEVPRAPDGEFLYIACRSPEWLGD
jgi:hypothetical protein